MDCSVKIIQNQVDDPISSVKKDERSLIDPSFFKERTKGLLLGGIAFATGIALSATGVGTLPASILINAGFGSLFDACIKTSADYGDKENFKQFIIGGIAGSIMSGFHALAIFPTKILGGKVLQACSINVVGYSLSESLNCRIPSVDGTLTAALSGAPTPIAGNCAPPIVQSMLYFIGK